MALAAAERGFQSSAALEMGAAASQGFKLAYAGLRLYFPCMTGLLFREAWLLECFNPAQRESIMARTGLTHRGLNLALHGALQRSRAARRRIG